ncbi:MAG: T9SS type A sorting domain-containing protein [Bacteroidetes bacterium]|nr:T9SS type A sorting domain-containing protein [Bacteroidota bacterium]
MAASCTRWSYAVQALALRHGKVFAGTCSGVYSIPYKLLPVDNGVGNNLGRGKLVIQVVPNPNKGDFSIRLQCSVAAPAVLSLRDMTGRLVYQKSLLLRVGANEIHIQEQSNIAPGVYVVQLVSGAEAEALPVLLH